MISWGNLPITLTAYNPGKYVFTLNHLATHDLSGSPMATSPSNVGEVVDKPTSNKSTQLGQPSSWNLFDKKSVSYDQF